MDLLPVMATLLRGGLASLGSYLAAHVLLCLVPAFFIAGGLAALIPKESVTRFLGRRAPKMVSYPAAALAGSVLAVCSCTIVPLFAGIYKKGAGIGPAITFLFFAPAGNILALAYTGVAIGPDLAFARLFLSLAFGIGIGLIMALIFRRADATHDRQADDLFAGQGGVRPGVVAFLLILVALLLAGTLKIGLLTTSHSQVHLPISGTDAIEQALFRLVPYDASRGEEGISFQGLALIGLLVLIGVSAWRGFENVHEGFNRWTYLALGLIALTLLVAAAGVTPQAESLGLRFPGGSSLSSCCFGGRLAGQGEAHRRRAPGLVVGVLALRQADLPLANRWRLPGRRSAPVDSAGMDRIPCRVEHRQGQLGRGDLRRLHVLPDAGRGADRSACSSTWACSRGRCWPT